MPLTLCGSRASNSWMSLIALSTEDKQMVGPNGTTLTLESKSPFDLRLDQSREVTESAIKKALRTGDMGFLHSFTTGSTVDGPGVRVVGWTAGCHWRCL